MITQANNRLPELPRGLPELPRELPELPRFIFFQKNATQLQIKKITTQIIYIEDIIQITVLKAFRKTIWNLVLK